MANLHKKKNSVFLLFIMVVLILLTPLTCFSLNFGTAISIFSSGIQYQKIFPEGSSESVKKISLSFSIPIAGQSGQHTLLNVPGCTTITRYGYPVPVKVITLDFPAGIGLSSVKITGGQLQEVKGEFKIPLFHGREGLEKTQNTGISFLPGTFIEAEQSLTPGGTTVSISIFPIQYNPATKKTLFLRDAEIEVSYGPEVEVGSHVLIPLSPGKDGYSTKYIDNFNANCIIITPQKYYAQAEQLKSIHENQPLGSSINTTIITTEEIAGRPYGATNQPPLASPNGLCPEKGFETRTDVTCTYRNGTLARSYNYQLARKILSFLLDCREAPGYKQTDSPGGYYSEMPYLQHIVILGNAVEVPPSYYAYSTVSYTGESYENYIPTDYFYSACSRSGLTNLNPYAGVGRFPVARTDTEEIYTGQIISAITGTTIRIQLSESLLPGHDQENALTGMTLVITSGDARNRWLDIQGSSWNAEKGELTLSLPNTAWITKEATTEIIVKTGNIVDIIDTRPQMQAMIDKVEAWVNARSGDNSWFRNVSFAGGTYKISSDNDPRKVFILYTPGDDSLNWDASVSSIYWNELSCIEAINKIDEIVEGGDGLSYVAGMGVRKYFASNIKPDGSTYDDAFIKTHIEKILQNDPAHRAGIFYFAGEGAWNGENINLEGSSISFSPLLEYTASTYNGLFISHADATGSFDEEICDSAINPYISFGKASLLSPAAAVAYFGPTREAVRSLSWSRQSDGLLTHSQEEANELTMNVLKRYHRAKKTNPTINEVVTKALGDYYTKNLASGTTKRDFKIIIEYNLLGSPAIYIPAPGQYSSDYEHTGVPVVIPLEPDRINSDNIPCYEVSDTETKTVSIEYTSQGGTNEIKLVDVRYYTGDDKNTGSTSGMYNFPAFDAVDSGKDSSSNGPGLYFIRVSQKEKNVNSYTKESRYYFEVVNKFTPQGNILVIDDDQPRRYTANSNNPDFTEQTWQFNYPDYEQDYYKNVLEYLGYVEGTDYKVWHVENKNGSNNQGQGRHGEVTPEVLESYIGEGKAVIWFTGNDWFTTILFNERNALQGFLDKGGKLFLTGQDIGDDIGGTSFYTNYLKAGYVQDNIGLHGIDGIRGDDLSDELEDITISGDGGAYNQRWPSEIDPQSGALPCLFYHPAGTGGGEIHSSGSAGIKYYNSDTDAAVVYFSFGFEGINQFGDINSSNGRVVVMNKVLTWLGSEKEPTTGNLDATGQDKEVVIDWKSLPVGGILIICKTGSYPTGDPIPVNGTTYSTGQEIAGGTVVYSANSVSSTGSYTHTSLGGLPLVNGTTYYYRAYSVGTGYIYSYFDIASATPQEGGIEPGELAKPTNLTATAIKEAEMWRIELTWTDNSSNPNEDGFEIQRKYGTNDWATLTTIGAGIQSYTDNGEGTGLEPDTIYYYRVRAYTVTPSQQSLWSDEVSAATSYMKAPTNLKAVGGEREVYLYWQFSSPGAKGFEIYRKHPTPSDKNPNWSFISYVTADLRSYRDELKTTPNIPDGRPYYYRIRAYNDVTQTDWSNETWTAPIPSAFPPGEDPTNLKVFSGGSAMTLIVQFNDNTNNESSYLIELWRTPPSSTEMYESYITLPALDGDSFTESPIIINFTKGGEYYIRVIAKHKTTNYGFSRYCTVQDDAGSNYISFELPEDISSSSTGGCFIATAAFGSPYEKHVQIFREFRDIHLLKSRAGRAFVRWYYRHSPSFAEYIRKRPVARTLVRWALRPIAWFLSKL